ncbi:phosphorylase family protein [Streptomyces ureilyticus]|uniref:Protein kinase domain-containing protein n=1 Tax=Streptomyces ureilyticus TaxID=1775131 RepID=A0ABX0DXM4_9ACTN|nr:hypothetical protein [Streptomyces ureilyticus]NGO46690.1 hypothetical protein [Streptomyces ureilyticus]
MGGARTRLPTVVVLTALPVEYEAVRRHLKDVREVGSRQGTRFDVGRISGLDWQIALAETGPTNTRAALITQHAVDHFTAAAVFFVGVAAALKDKLRLGDVVVASKIYGYHGGRESEDGFSARPVAWEPAYDMDQLVRSACRNGPWAFLTPAPHPSAQPDVRFEPLTSGDVLIDWRDSETVRRIRSHYNDAVAVDMESHGVAQAARMHRDVHMLTVRGISDFADGGKAAADARGSQRTASRNAAAFALRVLRDLRPAVPPPSTADEGPPLRPAAVVVTGPGRDTGRKTWESRPVVEAGGQEYLLYEGPGDLLHESRDGDVVRRQARARLVPDRNTRGSYVWLRQVELLRPERGSGLTPLSALEREAELCRDFRGPEVVYLGRRRNTATLALEWPADAKSGRPLDTLRELLPEPPAPPDSLRLHLTVQGLAAVAELLGRLHGKGFSHRALHPTAIVMDRPRMVLRDLGLAAVPPRPGESAGPYQAPEQRHGAGARPGPATDVHQLGALLQHALTGRPPAPGLPPYRPAGSVPPRLAQAVVDALQQDPTARPGIRELRLELLAAARELPLVP